MRISKSSHRRVSTRRAHRPDQRVYRTLRLGGIRNRRGGLLPMLVTVTLSLIVFVAIVVLITKAIWG